MKISNNKDNLSFGIKQNDKEQNGSQNAMLVNAGIGAGTTAVGAIIGYNIKSEDKVEIKSSVNQSSSTFLKKEIPGLKEIRTALENKFIIETTNEKNGLPAKVPNCIMLEGEHDVINNTLIDWTGEQVGKKAKCRFIKIKHTDDLLDHMEKAGAHHKQTKERTLIHVESFDRLINPEISDNSTIAACKDLMQCSSEDYHTTVIFSTKDTKKLDNAATSGHRIGVHIKVNLNPADFNKSVLNTGNHQKGIEEQIKKIPKTKLWAGTAIGLGLGVTIAGIRYLISKNKTDNK
jgi:hypothetical protein